MGLLTITLIGIVLAFLFSLWEFHANVKRISKKCKLPYGSVFVTELKKIFESRTKNPFNQKKSKHGGPIELL